MSNQSGSESDSFTYPIEVEFPDISAYAAGNVGVPYVFSFDSGKPGPHVQPYVDLGIVQRPHEG